MQNNQNHYQPEFEISVEIINLVNVDSDSKTDSFCQLVVENTELNSSTTIGLTEIVWDSLNPKYTKKFKLTQEFAEIQELKFNVYDTEPSEVKSEVPKINEKRSLGSAKILFIDLIKSYGKKMRVKIKNKKDEQTGYMQLYCEQIANVRDEYNFEFSCKNLKKLKGGFLQTQFGVEVSPLNPKINFQKVTEMNEWIKVCECRSSNKNNKMKFKSMNIPSSKFDNGDTSRMIKAEMVHVSAKDEDKYQDQFEFTVKEILDGKKEFNFVNNKDATFNFEKFESKIVQTQMDYINSGLNINLIIGIDYTASNMTAKLHQIKQGQPNQQQKCLQSVSNVMINQDTDKIVPMYGFGFNLGQMTANRTAHCHPLFQTPKGFCGVEELMAGYLATTTNPAMMMSGPTNFSPIMEELINSINTKEVWQYQMLMYITDGCITDFKQTVDLIVKCSDYPISILIVGVGDADFSKMEQLDNDKGQLQDSKGTKPKRDCVQFVEFKSCKDEFDLRSKLLKEIPVQMEKYYETKKIKPEDLKINPYQTNIAAMTTVDY